MISRHQTNSKIFIAIGVFFSLLCLFSFSNLYAQEKERYIVGETGELEMIVHIIGEVQQPGEYRVIDSTNLIELISKAAGPTEFSNLGAVTITRVEYEGPADGFQDNGRTRKINKIIKYNVNDYLKKTTGNPPPVLKPGDVVLVPRNNWHRWRNTFTILRDISVIASIVWLIDRAASN